MRNQHTFTGKGHDAPIEHPSDDLLDGLGVARAVHRFLKTTPPGWSTRIGLFGRWGSGKTSILNLLQTLEQNADALVIRFSAWSASGETGVIEQFYATLSKHMLAHQIKLPKAHFAKRIGEKLMRWKWLGDIGLTAAKELAPLPPAVVEAGVAALKKLGSATVGWTKVSDDDLQAIAKLLRGRRVVVFIDDIDRADPKLIPKSLLALRELLDWPGFTFVLAFDKRAVASALASYSTAFGEDADGFLEKIIDIPFEVPVPSNEHRVQLAHAAFLACCDLIPHSSIDAIALHLPTQPRRVKIVARMMGALGPSLARHSTEEVDWIGLVLYLILKEARPDFADRVIRAASDERGSWLSWAGDQEERKKKEQDTRAMLATVLASTNPPDDSDRVIDVALKLLEHCRYTSPGAIAYWSRLAFREPSITMPELLRLRDAYAATTDNQLIEVALRTAANHAGTSQEEASADVLLTAINCYSMSLESMASARTMADLDTHRENAESALLLLEHLYRQTANSALVACSSRAATVIPLIELVTRWIGWTRNDCEVPIRRRERELALAAARRSSDPSAVFACTDPYLDRPRGPDAKSVRDFQTEIRSEVAPLVASRLCARFLEVDGMVPVASGEDALGAWLVESEKSPLYTERALADKLLVTLQGGAAKADDVRSTLSKNARLYLKQLLFQTRDASWGGIESTKTIHGAHPLILPTAWSAVVNAPAPFRMLSSLRELRQDLIAIGVTEVELPVPAWLLVAEEPEA